MPVMLFSQQPDSEIFTAPRVYDAVAVWHACGSEQSTGLWSVGSSSRSCDIDGSETENYRSAGYALLSPFSIEVYVEEPLDWPHEVNGVVR